MVLHWYFKLNLSKLTHLYFAQPWEGLQAGWQCEAAGETGGLQYWGIPEGAILSGLNIWYYHF